MKKNKLTVQDVRTAIANMHDEELSSMIDEMSDEELLAANFKDDFGMDSLDVIEMTLEMERDNALHIPDSAYEKMDSKGGTIKDLLDAYNECI